MHRPDLLKPAYVAAAAGLVLAADLATVAVRTGRADAAQVVRSLDGVEGLALTAETRPDPGVEPCRATSMLVAADPAAVRTRDYAVTVGPAAVVGIAAYRYDDSGEAEAALASAYDGLTMCRGFRAVSRSGRAFRFEYLAIEPSGIGATGYLVRAVGRADLDASVRTDSRFHVFRRGRLVVVVEWQSTRSVDERQLRCLAERADAAARDAAGPECSAVPAVST